MSIGDAAYVGERWPLGESPVEGNHHGICTDELAAHHSKIGKLRDALPSWREQNISQLGPSRVGRERLVHGVGHNISASVETDVGRVGGAVATDDGEHINLVDAVGGNVAVIINRGQCAGRRVDGIAGVARVCARIPCASANSIGSV